MLTRLTKTPAKGFRARNACAAMENPSPGSKRMERALQRAPAPQSCLTWAREAVLAARIPEQLERCCWHPRSPGQGAAAPDPVPTAWNVRASIFLGTRGFSAEFEEQKGQPWGCSERGFLIPWCGNGMEKIPWRAEWFPGTICPLSKACSWAGCSSWAFAGPNCVWCLFKGDLLTVTPRGANDFRVSNFPP